MFIFIFQRQKFSFQTHIWYEKLAPKTGARKRSGFMSRVTGACAMDISHQSSEVNIEFLYSDIVRETPRDLYLPFSDHKQRRSHNTYISVTTMSSVVCHIYRVRQKNSQLWSATTFCSFQILE